MMRLWWIPVILVLAWFAYTTTPFFMLYDLARAVQARDVGYVERHVNFRTLRLSAIRQAAAAASQKRAEAGAETEGSRERQRLVDAAAALAEPLSESLFTPQTVIDLLDDGVPQSLDLGPLRPDSEETSGGHVPGLRIETLLRLVPYYLSSEMRGFRTVVIAVPPEAPRSQRFRLRLRLRGLAWRLVEIELTDELRSRIAAKVSRAKGRFGREPDTAVPPSQDSTEPSPAAR